MKTRSPLVVIPQFFGSLVYDRRTSRYMPFDRDCTSLLRRFTFEPVESVSEGRREILHFYDHFYNLGFFGLDGRFVGDFLEAEPPADHLLGPLAVHLEIVAACNLTCSHCFAGVLPRDDRPLTVAEIERLFGTLARMGSFRVGLTGGEPLLRRDLFDILDAALGHGLHPCLTTNGLLVTAEIAREFGRRDLVWLNVSLDGASAATNDLIRGQGTFDQVMEKTRILREHTRFSLAFTITSSNHRDVREFADLARRVGARTAVFRPLYPVGTAKTHLTLMPTFNQYNVALRSLTGDLHGIDPFSPQARADGQARIVTQNGCGAGNLVCSISVGGEVNPCGFLGSQFDAGNIRERSFEEIWHQGRAFKGFRDAAPEEFAGGCRARAQTLGGNVHAPDPWHREWLESRSSPHPLSNIEAQA